MVEKKAKALPPLKETILPAQADTVIEVAEIFTYVGNKSKQIRIWIAQNRQTRQIIAFFIGDGTKESCKRLWRKLPDTYLKCRSFSDLYASYNGIPKTTHTKIGKETGLTNHIERLNNIIRQRFSRMVRKTLSFSKKLYMLNLHFKLWAFEYNQQLVS